MAPPAVAPPPRQTRTHGLTEGAVLAALVALLAIATRYIPVVGMATVWLCPLPLAVLVIRHGLRIAALAGIVATLVGVLLAGPVVGFAILISFAPMGLVIGVGAQRHWPAARVVLLGTVASALSTAASFLGLMGGGATSLAAMAAEMTETMERSTAMMTDLYVRWGLPKAQADAIAAQFREFGRLLPSLLPAILTTSAATAAWLNYEVARRVLHRFGYHLAALPPMGAWRLPSWAVWALPLGYLLSAAGAQARLPELERAGAGVVLTLMLAFMLQGMLAAWVILGNLDLTKVERTIALVVAVSLSTAIPLINIAAFLLGVVDSALKIRERWGLPRGPRQMRP
ncbi:MAG: YybS family protein [Armatimonadota bacterium]|nr:YybS family protein [Armatimonadota bacterium]